MKYLEFEVKNMSVNRVSSDRVPIVSGAVNYYGIHVNFDDDFREIVGSKSIEFYKNRNKERVDLADGKCAIPNIFLRDKEPFSIRVLAGNTVATSWQNVTLVESGVILEENPDEPAPAGLEYVKTPSGDETVPYLRAGTNGLEFSKDGDEWQGGIEGVPEVPKSPAGRMFVRTYGDWVPTNMPVESIVEVRLNGEIVPSIDGVVDIAVQGLKNSATSVTKLDAGETDTAAIVSKINEVIDLLQSRGIATV